MAHTVCEHLRAKNLLVIVDNCEHVVTGCAQLTDVLIRNCSGVQVVATSREPLRIHGETVWTVPPLVPDEAVDLSVRRAHAAAAALPLKTDDLDSIRGLRPVGGHPARDRTGRGACACARCGADCGTAGGPARPAVAR